jgi:hypothetical protein
LKIKLLERYKIVFYHLGIL